MDGRTEAALRAESTIEQGRTRQSLETLYEAHAPAAHRLAFLLSNDSAIAEDIVQEAFARVVGHFTDLRHPDRFGGYLYRTIVNLVRGRHRRRLLEERFTRRERAGTSYIPDHAVALSQRDPLWRALLELPQRQRAVLFLRYYVDLTERETAEALDCSVSAVKSLSQRAMRSLHKEMEGDNDG